MTANVSIHSETAAVSAAQPVQKYSIFGLLTRLPITVMRGLHSAITGLQHARMMSTLSAMSDAQLTHIGITRSDIPNYAETLMAKETDQKT